MPEPTSVGQALAQARALGVDRLDAHLLLAHVLGCTRAWLIAHQEADLSAERWAAFASLISRRATGEPLAYLVGAQEFRSLRLRVSPDVLIPRPDTETLVEWALELLPERESPTIADLGTGSGAIALALKHARPHARVHGSDFSAAALTMARATGHRLGLAVSWHLGDWWQAIAPSRVPHFELVVANPPYIAPGDHHLAGLRHEPQSALVPRDDDGAGLADMRRIVEGAQRQLRAGGWLLLEHGFDQAAAVRDLLRAACFEAVASRADLGGNARVTGGRKGMPDH